MENWRIDLRDCLFVWRAGCIIQALGITDLFDRAYAREALLPTPALDEEVARELHRTYPSLKRVVALGVECDAVIPSLSASLDYVKAIGGRDLPTSFMEMEMDVFGASCSLSSCCRPLIVAQGITTTISDPRSSMRP